MIAALPGRALADIWHHASEWLDLSWNVSLDETYDDNIFNAPEDEESDFVTSVGFNTKFVIRHPLGQFNLFYRFDQSFYLEHDELNDVGSLAGLGQNQNLSFTDSLNLSPLDVVTYYVGVSRSPESLHLAGQERRSDLQDVDLEGVVIGRDPVTRATGRLSYTHQFHFPVNFGLNGGYTLTEYDDPTRFDSRSTDSGASLSWRITRVRSLGVQYSLSVIEFDSLEKTRSDIYSVVYQDAFASTWSFSAEAGVSVNDTPDNSVDDVTPEFDVRLKKNFRRGEVTIGYSRTVSGSEGLGGASEHQTLTAAGTYQHSEVWRSSLSATFSERLSGTTGQDPRRLTVRYNTGYPLTRKLRVNGGYLYSRQEFSDGSGSVDVTNNQIFVGLTYGAHLL